MPRTFIRQDTQIRNSDLYDDSLTVANYLTATNIEEDLNYVRSQLHHFLGQSAWYGTIPDNFDLTNIHDKRFTYWVQKTDDVAVPNGQNYVALSGSTKPSNNIAYGASTLGAITAQLAGAIGSNDTTTGANNGGIVELRDAATNDPIYTSGQPVYGILQVGSAATDGNAFGDSGNDQGQLSFVYLNPSTEAWTAVPVADIEDKTVEYAYKVRTDFYNLPENAFDPSVTFVEPSSDIDLQDVYDNDADGQFDLSAGKNYTANLNGNADFEVVDGATEYLVASQTDTALKSAVNNWLLATSEQRFYDANSSNYVGFEAASDLSGDQIWVLPVADGTDGQIIYTDGSGNLAWKDAGGENKKAWYLNSGNIAADTPIDISSFTGNPDSMVFGTSASDWQKNYDVYVNGVLQLSGTSAATNYDVYWLSNTTIAFEYNVKNNDVVTIIQRQ